MRTRNSKVRGPKSASGVAIASAKVIRWQLGEQPKRELDDLAREEPLEIRVRGKTVVVTMRTPGEDRELAAGFLLSEGLLRKPDDLLEIAYCQRGESANYKNILNVFVAPHVEPNFKELTRHVYASSSCGLCGKTSIEAVHQHFEPIQSKLSIESTQIALLPAKLRIAQEAFDRTGGLHAAAIFDSNGELLVLREDVGRHNAVDKVLGHCFLEKKFPLDSHILLVSGRASFEIMQKALSARIPIIAAISAPSSLAVEFAKESGQTLIGFLRGLSMNIYSWPKRIIRE